MKYFISFLAVFLLASLPARAEGLFGAAGNPRCGVGTKIWGKAGNSISTQWSEMSTNNISLESVSVTTGTSGCSNSGLVNATQKEIFYANVNYEELRVEMSEGKGEILLGFAQTLGCDGKAIPRFVSMAKERYEAIYPSGGTSPLEMIGNLKRQMELDPVIAAGCRSFTI